MTSQHVMCGGGEEGVRMSLTRRHLPSFFWTRQMTSNLTQSLKEGGGLRTCLGCLPREERRGNLCIVVISSFKMIHASLFLWFVTWDGVKSRLQPNDKQSANMQTCTPQSQPFICLGVDTVCEWRVHSPSKGSPFRNLCSLQRKRKKWRTKSSRSAPRLSNATTVCSFTKTTTQIQ